MTLIGSFHMLPRPGTMDAQKFWTGYENQDTVELEITYDPRASSSAHNSAATAVESMFDSAGCSWESGLGHRVCERTSSPFWPARCTHCPGCTRRVTD